ncbi:hypothetical protein ACFPES_05925 [Paenibacillus sp. GCM10023248]|uniref:hypothetical protein n=1 Tax=unclassified Paenibacillus TaxID=185978 RepID=UPI00237819AD|nr:hypothetical protein [Paenibacillus sp. MAHUQ-63]MDD9266569.1 hypothetical protein [Paenibacillus sp. MAHUQ-63]
MKELMQHEVITDASMLLDFFIAIPILLVIIGLILSRLHAVNAWIPMIHTLSLTMCSMSIIAGGKGIFEYHFSIFMVLAILIAVQHLAGFVLFPELVCGSPGSTLSRW